MRIVSAAFLLFLVMDPVGNIPVFLTTLKQVEQRRRPVGSEAILGRVGNRSRKRSLV